MTQPCITARKRYQRVLLGGFETSKATPSNNPSLLLNVMSHYAELKFHQFRQYGRLKGLAEAIDKTSQAVENTSEDEPAHVFRLDILGVVAMCAGRGSPI